MRIIYAIDAVKGAPIVHTYGSCRTLIKRGHSVRLITNAPAMQFEEIGAEVTKVRDVAIKQSAAKTFVNDLLILARSLFKSGDVFYTRNALLAAMFKILRPFTPVVWEVNGLSSVEMPILGEGGGVKLKLATFLEESALPHLADGIIVVTKGLGRVFLLGETPAEKLFLVRNGVDHEQFTNAGKDGAAIGRIREKYGIRPDEAVLVFVGKVYAWHGVDNMVAILSGVLERKKGVKLLFVGDRMEELSPAVQGMIKGLSLENNIIFTGWVDNRDVPYYVAASDAGIHTGTHGYELNPVKILEYMSAQKPVIGTIYGLSELLSQSGGGVAVDPLDCEGSAAKIVEMLENPDSMREMGRSALKYIVENHDWGVVTAELEKALFSAARSHGKGAAPNDSPNADGPADKKN